MFSMWEICERHHTRAPPLYISSYAVLYCRVYCRVLPGGGAAGLPGSVAGSRCRVRLPRVAGGASGAQYFVTL